MTKFLELTFICFLAAGCSAAQDCKEGINLLPMYGNVKKCEQQLAADREFIASIDSKYKDRKTAASEIVESGWYYFYKNELETSMKRFNQAWLLDSLNSEVYWGFGNLLGRKGSFKASIPYFKRSLKLKKDNPKVYESLSTSYGQLYVKTKDRKMLDKAVECLKKANSLDKNNPRILAQLTAAYCYYSRKDSAYKYKELTDRIDPEAIPTRIRAFLSQK